MGEYKSVKKAMHNNVLDRINMSLGASSSLDEKKAMREMKEELRKSGAGAAIANKNLTRIVDLYLLLRNRSSHQSIFLHAS